MRVANEREHGDVGLYDATQSLHLARPLKRYASWVQNVVRQFGPYPAQAEEI